MYRLTGFLDSQGKKCINTDFKFQGNDQEKSINQMRICLKEKSKHHFPLNKMHLISFMYKTAQNQSVYILMVMATLYPPPLLHFQLHFNSLPCIRITICDHSKYFNKLEVVNFQPTMLLLKV